ncbi:adenylate cyclase [Duganella sp. Leaf126]|uniref:CYTH domain-containing protein n=1 Tax=Duganella sp. Leaf126 TaxID=1736266 RepID=UPI0006F4F09C|nr:CYTH domain-containing protein [Duganella sp. Leaf126]KQQ31966.1 adenylate cyclase [Duganella sp. Leaf126]
MGVEIERKFLVRGDAWQALGAPVYFRQGYLSSHKERTVRVRIEGERAVLTIKGRSVGATRSEWEYPIPLAEAAQLLDGLCEQPLIEKCRRRIAVGRHVWEVDEFLGANAGLVVAEIELGAEDEAFDKPEWVGQEVTDDARYYNSNLIRHPFSNW